MSAFGMIQTIKTNRAMQRSGQLFRENRFYSSYGSSHGNRAIMSPEKLRHMREQVEEGIAKARRSRLTRFAFDAAAIICMTYFFFA